MAETTLSTSSLEALKYDRDRFVAFAFASSDMLIELNDEHLVTYIDGATRGFLGEDAEHFLNHSFIDFLAPDQEASWEELLKSIEVSGRAQQRKMFLHSRLFDKLPVVVSGVTLPKYDSALYLSFTILKEEMQASDITTRDTQTGLLNKETFAKRAAERMRELVESGQQVKMSLLDLPNLEEFLDALAPEQAKQLGKDIADYIRKQSVDNDMAGRIDVDKFSFVHVDSIEESTVVNDVQALIARLDPSMQNFKARMSSLDGDAGGLNDEDSARAIFYTLGRFSENNENFSFDSIQQSYDSLLEETVTNITQFKSTVEDDSFNLAYQPIVDLRSGVIHHYEALVRLKKPEDSAFSNPFEFVTFGERTGLIGEFDLAMSRRALETLDRSHEKGKWPQIAINLSGKSLSSKFFMDTFIALMGKFPHVRKQLIIEVTESAKISDMELANNFLQELRMGGHTCCLDDFGVAESSFDYLRHLHVDYVKIDGSYVRDNLTTTRGRHLLRAMVGMCRNLGMTTIGEMVEDEKTAQILWESGVHYGQGWLFGKPDEEENTLEGWNKKCDEFKGLLSSNNADDGKEWLPNKNEG